jgi:carboxylate-amine ligase
MCLTVDETICVVALIQAVVAKLYKLLMSNTSFNIYRIALIRENKFRAARNGLEGKLIDFGKKAEVPTQDLILELLGFVDDVVDELGSRKEIEYVHQILTKGTGADQQLAVFEKTKDTKQVVDYIVGKFNQGI